MYYFISFGNPFDRRDFLKNVSYYVEKGWGSYNELIDLSMKDFIEIKIGLESKAMEEKIDESTSSGMHGF